MAKDFYIRIRTAGRYRLVARCSRPLPGDSDATRTAKQAATTAAQKYINIKNATERLQLLLCANFDSKEACFCTFTCTDETLPANRKHIGSSQSQVEDTYGKECFNGTNSFVMPKGQRKLVILIEDGKVSSIRYEVILE